MAELRRQSSSERFLLDFLTKAIGLRPSVAARYVPELVEQGYDTEEIFLTLSAAELKNDFDWKKGHIQSVEAFRKQKGGSQASQAARARRWGHSCRTEAGSRLQTRSLGAEPAGLFARRP